MNHNMVGAISPQHFQDFFDNDTFDNIEKQILNIFICDCCSIY